MNIKKVYLAKSNLASGLDVEYVKSNLSRIPNLQILEYGSGTPEEADCVVIVKNSATVEEEFYINKNISKTLETYLEVGNIDNVFVYTGMTKSDHGDLEKTTPLCNVINSFTTEIEVETEETEDGEEVKEKDWQTYGSITLSNEQLSLLDCVCFCVDTYIGCWKRYPRHYVQKPEFALPPMPSADSRQSVKRLKANIRVEIDEEQIQEKVFNNFNKGTTITYRRKRFSV